MCDWVLVHTSSEEFENGTLFLWLDPLPSTLLRQRKRSFSKTLIKPEEFEKPALNFNVDGKHF